MLVTEEKGKRGQHRVDQLAISEYLLENFHSGTTT
jgi:hypothetical protein